MDGVLDQPASAVAESGVVRDVVFGRAGFLAGARQSVPLAISVATYGLVFGVLARQAGLGVSGASLMSAIVYAGAAQFAVLGLWQPPLPIATIVLTTFIVNLRHVLMGASLRPYLATLSPLTRYGLLFFLTDESWALTIGYLKRGGRDVAFLLGSGVMLFFGWQSATFVGGALAGVVTDPTRLGLDYAFTAVFLALLVGLFRGKGDVLPWLTAAVVAGLASQLLPGKWYILLGGIAGSLVGALRDES
jgi:4-azaleucine resistance transporter AzlC